MPPAPAAAQAPPAPVGRPYGGNGQQWNAAAPAAAPAPGLPRRRVNLGKFAGIAAIVIVAVGIIGAAVWAGVTASKRVEQAKVETVVVAQKTEAVRLCEQANVILNAQHELQTAGKSLDPSKIEEAKQLADKALGLVPDFPPALLHYARALSFQGSAQCDTAVEWFDRAIARAAAPDLPAEDRNAALKIADDARVWKVATLTADGQAQEKANNSALARKRFQSVIAAVESSPKQDENLAGYKKFAENELTRLAFVPAPGGSAPAPTAGGPGSPDDSIPSSTPGYPVPSVPLPSSTATPSGTAPSLPPDWTKNGGLPPGWNPDSMKEFHGAR